MKTTKISIQLKRAITCTMVILTVLFAAPINQFIGIDFPDLSLTTSAAALTQSQFNEKLSSARSKYPDGTQKYEWSVNGAVVGWQCHGYARWLSWYVWGVDFANGKGANWTLYKSTSSSSYIDKLVQGDVVRYRTSTSKTYNHTIFITNISGNTVYFTDCNSDGRNTIKWNRSISKSTLSGYLKTSLYGSEAAPYGYIAHYTPNTLGSAVNYSVGQYKVSTTAGLRIRSSASTSGTQVGLIPYNTTVNVTKISGNWGYTSYNGVNGWICLDYTSYVGSIPETHTHNYNKTGYEKDHPHKVYKLCSCGKTGAYTGATKVLTNCTKCCDSATYTLTCSPSSVTMKVGETKTVKFTESSSGFAVRIGGRADMNMVSAQFGNWEDSCRMPLTIKALKPGKTTIYVELIADLTGKVVKTYELPVTITSSHTHNYNTSGYEKDHPHKEYKKCACGAYYYTGATKVLTNCTKCCDSATYTLTCSPSSVTMKVGETRTVKFTESSSGFAVRIGGRADMNMVSAQFGNWEDSCRMPLTIKALKPGKTTVYVELIADLTGKVVKTYELPVTITTDSYTLSYNANGGSGAPSKQTGAKSYTISSTVPKRTGYTFLGWSKSSSASSPSYKAGDKISLTSDTILYAVWKKAHTHSYTEKVSETEPTCTQKGTVVMKCSCGATTTKYTEDALGHSFGKYPTIDQLPDCTHSGSKSYHCKRCDYKKDVTSIKPIGHKFGKWKTVIADGEPIEQRTCYVCGYVEKRETEEPDEHDYESVVKTRATMTSDGVLVDRCTDCGKEINKTTIAKIATVKLSSSSYAYTGKVISPSVTVKDSKGKSLKKGTDYTVKYSGERKNPGEYSVTVTFIGKYSGTKTISFDIVPGKTSLKVTADKGKASLKWSKKTEATGYVVYMATSKNGKYSKIATVKGNSNVSYTKTGLTKGKTYYFKVAAYTYTGGTNLYGSFSSVKSAKIK